MSYHLSRLFKAGHDVWIRARDGIARAAHGLLPRRSGGQDKELDEVEVAVKEVLHPVAPTDGFRENLRSSLDRAERARREGIVVNDPPPYREGILLGLAATGAAVAGLVIWCIYRWQKRQRIAS